MDYLKSFLDTLTKSGIYYAEIVDNIAEIYIMGDPIPAILLEIEDDTYKINIRSDITPRLVAQLTYDMTTIDEDITIGPDFFVNPDHSIVYGKDATEAFLSVVYNTMEDIKLKEDVGIENVTYIVTEPIQVCGNNNIKQNKLQRMWGTDFE
jgi:hypothetical protein